MNDIRPFRGLRFDEAVVGPLGSVFCPPYDVISPEEQVALHDRSPFNVVRLELGYEAPEDGPSNNRYTRAAATLDRWLTEGVLRQEQEPAFYLYEQEFTHEGRTLVRRGVFGCLRLARWEEGVVLPHEETLAKPKADRLQLMLATACNLSPVYLLFDDPSGTARQLIAEGMSRPADATADLGDGQLHRLWVASGAERRKLQAALATPQLYVADGHHRYETALAYRDEMRAKETLPSPHGEQAGGGVTSDAAYNFGLMLLVDARELGLVVLPTHRIVRGIDPAVLSGLHEALASRFQAEVVAPAGAEASEVAEALLQRLRDRGQEGPALGLYRRGLPARVLRLRGNVGQPAGSSRPLLDVDVLQDLVLEPLLGIGAAQLKAGTHVAYTRDAAEAISLVDRGDGQAAFLLNATRVDQVLATARAGGKMPQKSTYFFPKPATGLVINRLLGTL